MPINWKPSSWKDVRFAVMFCLGFGGAVRELFLTDLDKPYRLAFCGALMGLSVYLKANGR